MAIKTEGKFKALSGEIHYGSASYPIQEANLPEVDAALFVPIVDEIRKAVKKLTNFTAAQPEIMEFSIVGNGYVVRFQEMELED